VNRRQAKKIIQRAANWTVSYRDSTLAKARRAVWNCNWTPKLNRHMTTFLASIGSRGRLPESQW
jgi:hypothetical protein